jgi:hypothetical protein
MTWYQQTWNAGGPVHDIMLRLCQRIAAVVIDSLDAVRSDTPLPKGSLADVERLYQWALRFPGSGLAHYGAAPAFVTHLVAEKHQKGLL